MSAAPSVIAITDCGSTTTKAILIERRDGVYRQTARGEAPTTVEAPVEDVTVGVISALEALHAQSGRRIVDERGAIIRPASGADGVDLFLSTSSAGGGLQMVVAGLVARFSARAAERAALGAGAIVAQVLSCDDGRTIQERIERLERLRPDMVLLAGGTDGGAAAGVVEMAQLIAAAHPRPRFGGEFSMPVVYAGNPSMADEISRIVSDRAELFVVSNVLPSPEREDLDPARELIHELFLNHVMQQAPGFLALHSRTDAPILPTPSAVGAILRLHAAAEKANVLAVDIGGATTDVFSIVDGAFNRTVSANLGVSYSASFVLDEAGVENVRRWLPYRLSSRDLRDAVLNKALRPTTIPDDEESLLLEQALAREALRLSFSQHMEFSRGSAGVRRDRSFDENLAPRAAGRGSVGPGSLGTIIGSGGVLAHAPRAAQTAAMLIDAFAPVGVTRLAKDSIFMLPHLGALSQLHPDAARDVLDRDCIVSLGTCVAPSGRGRIGRPCIDYVLDRGDGSSERGVVAFGEAIALCLERGASAQLHLRPRTGFDVGRGRSSAVDASVRGGDVGVVIDCRGRPLAPPDDQENAVAAQRAWLEAIGALGRAR